MDTTKGNSEGRTPQACDRCRRSKTKCSGVRPRCHSCLKRKLICSWPKAPAPGNYYPVNFTEAHSILENSNGAQLIPDVFAGTKSGFVPPATHLLQRLFRIFIVRHHDVELCSFLHKPTTNISILCGQSPLLVTSILSLSAIYISENEAEKDFGVESATALSEHYAKLARSYAQALFDEPSVSTIQAYLILAIRELVTWTNFKAWGYAGIAIRMAQALQLGSELNRHHSTRQKEIRRRTFWACFVVDRLISYHCNQSFSIGILSARAQLPCPEDVFAFEEEYSGLSLENIILHTDHLSRLGIAPFFITMVHLWGKMASLHISGGRRHSIYAPTDPAGEFYQNEKAISDFASSLPPRLRWSVRNYKLHQDTGQAQAFVNLSFLLQHSKCVMHQEYLPQLDSQYGFKPDYYEPESYDTAGISLDHVDQKIIRTCIDAVHEITDMVTVLSTGSENDHAMLQSVFVANALMTASAAHLWIIHTQTCDRCPKDVARANYGKLLQVIKSWQPRWRVAFAWAETLEVLYKLYDFAYGVGAMSDFDFLTGGANEISESAELVEEVTDNNGVYPALSDGDCPASIAAMCQRLHDKVRNIILNPLHSTEVKKRNLRIYCRSLWQQTWIYESLSGPAEDVSNMGDIMGSNDPVIFSIPGTHGTDVES